jgi:hypothetical protein
LRLSSGEFIRSAAGGRHDTSFSLAIGIIRYRAGRGVAASGRREFTSGPPENTAPRTDPAGGDHCP